MGCSGCETGEAWVLRLQVVEGRAQVPKCRNCGASNQIESQSEKRSDAVLA